MKLLIGLGNPGEKYKNTRHNVGFMVVDRIVTSDKAQVTRSLDPKLVTCYLLHDNIVLAKPQTFMNESGRSVKKLVNYYKINISDLWVIHDDLDIKLGQYKIQFGVGPKLHYGIQSIDKALGTSDYWRVRIGVDNRTNDKEQRTKGEPSFAKASEGKEYVLQDFREDEIEVRDSVIGEVVGELRDRIMNYEL